MKIEAKLSKVIDGTRRRIEFILKNEGVFSLRERIQLASSIPGDDKRPIKILKKRIRRDDSQRDYFDLRKFKIYFDFDLNISNTNYFLKGITRVIWETFVIPEFLHPIVKPREGDIIFDLGANIGTTTLLLAEIAGKNGRVYSFEPVTLKTLKQNITINNINNVIVIPKGVSSHSGETEIEISDFCLDSSIAKRDYTKNYYVQKRKIELVTIDGFCEENQIDKVDFVKMDIEGVEELAICGAKKLIERCHPMWSISSYHIDYENEPQHSKLLNLLREQGYKIFEAPNYHIWAL